MKLLNNVSLKIAVIGLVATSAFPAVDPSVDLLEHEGVGAHVAGKGKKTSKKPKNSRLRRAVAGVGCLCVVAIGGVALAMNNGLFGLKRASSTSNNGQISHSPNGGSTAAASASTAASAASACSASCSGSSCQQCCSNGSLASAAASDNVLSVDEIREELHEINVRFSNKNHAIKLSQAEQDCMNLHNTGKIEDFLVCVQSQHRDVTNEFGLEFKCDDGTQCTGPDLASRITSVASLALNDSALIAMIDKNSLIQKQRQQIVSLTQRKVELEKLLRERGESLKPKDDEDNENNECPLCVTSNITVKCAQCSYAVCSECSAQCSSSCPGCMLGKKEGEQFAWVDLAQQDQPQPAA